MSSLPIQPRSAVPLVSAGHFSTPRRRFRPSVGFYWDPDCSVLLTAVHRVQTGPCRPGEGCRVAQRETHPGLFVHLVLEVAEGPADFCYVLALSVAAQGPRLLLRYADAHTFDHESREEQPERCTLKPVCLLPVFKGLSGGLTCMLRNQRCWTRTSDLERGKTEKTAGQSTNQHRLRVPRATSHCTGILHRDFNLCTFLSLSQALNLRVVSEQQRGSKQSSSSVWGGSRTAERPLSKAPKPQTLRGRVSGGALTPRQAHVSKRPTSPHI